MKRIISDSLWAHMFMFFLLIHFMIMWLAVGMLHPVLFVIVGSIYVLNIINSAINLMELINKHYEPEVAQELERRFINSIKGADTTKFTRGIRKITESKRSKKDEDVG